MKLLLCIASLNDVAATIQHFNAVPQPHPVFKYLHPVKILQHEVELLETGVGVYQTCYKVTRVLAQQRYHLALKISFGNSYNRALQPGTVLNIINEKPGDYGSFQGGTWVDHYDAQLINTADEPHVRGGLINLTNAYTNVFMPFKKAVGITVNHYAQADAVTLRREKYRADCETGDGLGFTYPCLYEKQSFYHLCVIERNLTDGREDFNAAKQKLNEVLVDLLNKL